MNKRIKELAEQAGLEFDDDLALEPEPIYYITQKELERFAALLIRKCADIATMNQYQSYTPGHYVLKHFGVEE